jgi:hypothetical protein
MSAISVAPREQEGREFGGEAFDVEWWLGGGRRIMQVFSWNQFQNRVGEGTSLRRS